MFRGRYEGDKGGSNRVTGMFGTVLVCAVFGVIRVGRIG